MSSNRSDDQLYEAMLERTRRTIRAIADRVEDIGGGFVASTPSLPSSWSLNRLHLAQPVSAEAAAALADRHQSEQDFRHIIVEHDPGDRLATAFADAGWTVGREVHMVLGDPPAPVAGPREIVEVEGSEGTQLNRMWIEEDHSAISADALEQLTEMTVREGRYWRERVFGIRAEGRLVAMTKLRSDDEVAWVRTCTRTRRPAVGAWLVGWCST